MIDFEIRFFERKSKKNDRTRGSRSGSTPLAADRPIASARSERLARARSFNYYADHPPTPLNSDVGERFGDMI